MLQRIYKLNSLILWAKRNRIVNIQDDVIKLNIGSGLTIYKGWINIDGNISVFLSNFPEFIKRIFFKYSNAKKAININEYTKILKENKFLHHNVQYGLPFKDSSVDYIYSSHFFEHLYRKDGEMFLKECYRVCEKNGVIRICIPDLAYVIQLYLDGNEESALEYFFLNNENPKYFNSHKYMYNFKLMKQLLSEVGFSDIKKCEYQVGEVPDIKHLDIKPEETLYIEAKKK